MRDFWINSGGETGAGNGMELCEPDSPVEVLLAAKWDAFAPRLHTSLFRFYGGITNDKPELLLSTEFVYFSDDPDARARIDAYAKAVDCVVNDMGTYAYLDPDHGRLQTQVSIETNVLLWSLDQVAAQIERMRAAAAEVDQYWMEVL